MKLPGFWILSFLCLAIFAKSIAEEPRVVCYYTNWSIYRPGNAKYSPQNINPYLCTHLIYAFGGFTKDNTLQPFDKYQDIEKGGYAKFTGLKTYNKNLKTMLAIGGWNEASSRFSPLVGDADRRRTFVKNTIKYLRQNHFDGLDLDWEYPTFRDGGKPKDRVNYAQFVQELREEFDRESSKTGRTRLLLTLAIPAGVDKIEQGYDVEKLNQYLDWFNLLTYDYHDSFEPATNHHAPLYSLEEDNEYNFDGDLNIDFSVKHLINAGADRQKLVLGIPTYGRSYTLFNPDATDIGAPTDGPGDPGDATREKGFLAYYEICQNIKSDDEWTVMHPNDNVMGPYLYKDDQWISYDDEKMVRRKAQYAAKNGLGGIMFWSIDTDDFRGTCSGKPYPLIEAAKEGYYDALGIKSTDTQAITVKPPPRNRKRPTKKPIVSNEASISIKDNFNRRRKPSQTTTRVQPKPTQAAIVYNSVKTTTPEPPTTPDPGSDFKCEEEGFFSHPRDCKKYFWCLDSGPANLGIVAHQFTCPSGLLFNKQADSCDYARNVACSKPKPATTTTGSPPTTTSKTTTRAATTQRTTTFRTTTSRPTTTTSTTTPAYEYDDEEYDDEIEDSEIERDIEDPKVIKELINLIKKAGGLDKLEKHLKISADNTQVIDTTKSTTQATFSKSLYDKVLIRKPANRFSNTENANKIKSDQEVVSVTPKVNNTRYSSVYRNSRPSPQNAGLDSLPDFDAYLKEKPQYVTIQRQRTTTSANPNSDEDDASQEDAESEYSTVDATTKSVYRTTAQPQYVNIQRNRVTTESTDSDESDLEEIILNPFSRPIESSTLSSQYTTINRGRTTNIEVLSGISSSSDTESAVEYSTVNRERKPENNTDSVETASISDTKSTQYTTINRGRRPINSEKVETSSNSETGSTQYGTINRGRRPDNSNSEETSTISDAETTTQYATINRGRRPNTSVTSEKVSSADSVSTQYTAIKRGRRPDKIDSIELSTEPETEATTEYTTINRRRKPENGDTTEVSTPSDTESTTQYSTINRRRRPETTAEISSISDTVSTAHTSDVSSSVNSRTQTRYQTFNRGSSTARPLEDLEKEENINTPPDSSDKSSSSREEAVDTPAKRVFPVIINSDTKYQTITRNQIKTTLVETPLPSTGDDIIIPQNNTTDHLADNAIQKETPSQPTSPPPPATPVINHYSIGINLNNTNNELNTKQNQLDYNLTDPTNTINISANQINSDITYTLKSPQSLNVTLNDLNDIHTSNTVKNVTEFITTKLSSPRPFGFQTQTKTILLNQTQAAPKVSQVENLETNKPISYPNNNQQANLGKNATKQESEIMPLVDRTRFSFSSYASPNSIIDYEGTTLPNEEPEVKSSLNRQGFKFVSSTGSKTITGFEQTSPQNLGSNTVGEGSKSISHDRRGFRISSATNPNSSEDFEQKTISSQTSFKSRNSPTNLEASDNSQGTKVESSFDRRGFRFSSATKGSNSNEDIEQSKISSHTISKSRNSTRTFSIKDIAQEEQKAQSSFDRRGFRNSSVTTINLMANDTTIPITVESESSTTILGTEPVNQEQKFQSSLDNRGFKIASTATWNNDLKSYQIEQTPISKETELKSQNSTVNLDSIEAIAKDTKFQSSSKNSEQTSISNEELIISSSTSSHEVEQTTLYDQILPESQSSSTHLSSNGLIEQTEDLQQTTISSQTTDSVNSSDDVEQATISSQTSFNSRNSTIHLKTNDTTHETKTSNEVESETSTTNLVIEPINHEQTFQSTLDSRGFRISSTAVWNSQLGTYEVEQIPITKQTIIESQNVSTHLDSQHGKELTGDLKKSEISSQTSFKSRNSTRMNTNLNTNDETQDTKTRSSVDRRGYRISSTGSSSDLEQTTISNQTSHKSRNSTNQGQTIQNSFDRRGFRISSATSTNLSEDIEQSTIPSQISFRSRNSTTNLNTNDASHGTKTQFSFDRRGNRVFSTAIPNVLEETTETVVEYQTSTTNLESNGLTSKDSKYQPSSGNFEQASISNQDTVNSLNLGSKSFDTLGFQISSATGENVVEETTIVDQTVVDSQNTTTNLGSLQVTAADGKFQSSSGNSDKVSITGQTTVNSHNLGSNSFDTLGFQISSATGQNVVEGTTTTDQTVLHSQNTTKNLDSNGILSKDTKHQSSSDNSEQASISNQEFQISSSIIPNEVEQTNETLHKTKISSISFGSNLEVGEQTTISSETNFDQITKTDDDAEGRTISSQSSPESQNLTARLGTNDTSQEAKIQSFNTRGFRISSSSHTMVESQNSKTNSETTLSTTTEAPQTKPTINRGRFRVSTSTSPKSTINEEQGTASGESFQSQNNQEKQGATVNYNSLLNRNVRPTNLDENSRTLVDRRRPRPTQVTSTTEQEIISESTERTRTRQRVRITPSTSSNSQSSFDRRGFRISTSSKSNSSTDFEQTNLNSDVTKHASSIDSATSQNAHANESSVTTHNIVVGTTIFDQTVLDSQNTKSNLDSIVKEAELELQSDNFEQGSSSNQTTDNSFNVGANSYDTLGFQISSVTGQKVMDKTNISDETVLESQNVTTNYDSIRVIANEAELQSQSDNFEQASISNKNTINSRIEPVNHEQTFQSTLDSRGFKISSTAIWNSQLGSYELDQTQISKQTDIESQNLELTKDLKQSEISSQTSFKSRNSTRNLNTNDSAQDAKMQASLDRRGYRISSATNPNLNEDVEQSTNHSQISFRSRNSTSLNTNDASHGTKTQFTFDRRGNRVFSTAIPSELEQTTQTVVESETSTTNFGSIEIIAKDSKHQSSSGNFEQASISNQTSTVNSLNLASNSFDTLGFQISSATAQNVVEETTISDRIVVESQNTTTNLGSIQVTTTDTKFESSSGNSEQDSISNQTFQVSSSGSPNEVEQTTIFSQTSFDQITQTDDDAEGTTISSQSSAQSQNLTATLGTNDTSQDAGVQTSFNSRGFSISSSSQTLVESQNSNTNSDTKPTINRGRFRTSTTSPTPIIDEEQGTNSREILFQSRKNQETQGTTVNYNSLLNRNVRPTNLDELSSLTSFDFNRRNQNNRNVVVRRRPRPTQVTSTTGQDINSESTERTRIRQRVRITPSTSTNSQSSSDRRGFRISTSARSNSSADIEQTNLNSDITKHASSLDFATSQSAQVNESSLLTHNVVVGTAISDQTVLDSQKTKSNLDLIVKEAKLQSQSDNFEQGSNSNQTTDNSLNVGSNSYDTLGFQISSVTGQKVVDKTNISNETVLESQNVTTNYDPIRVIANEAELQSQSDNFEQASISNKNTINSRIEPVNHEQTFQSTLDSRGFKISSTAIWNSQLGSYELDQTQISKQTDIESQNLELTKDLKQSEISSQTSFKSRNSTKNLNTNDSAQDAKIQASLDRRGYRISSATNPNLNEDVEQSTNHSQISFRSRNSTSLNTNDASHGTKTQFTFDRRGNRVFSTAIPSELEQTTQTVVESETSTTNFGSIEIIAKDSKHQSSSGNFEQASISNQTSTVNSLNLASNSFDTLGFQIPSATAQNVVEETTISDRIVVESQNTTTNLGSIQVTTTDTKFESSSGNSEQDSISNQTFQVSSSGSPNEVEQTTIFSQTSFDQITQTDDDAEGTTISSQSSAQSQNLTAILGTNDTSQDTEIQTSLNSRGFSISSSSQTLVESQNSNTKSDTKPTINRGRFRTSTATSPIPTIDEDQGTNSRETLFQSRKNQETQETAVTQNSLLNRNVRPTNLDELSSLTSFDFNRRNQNNRNVVVRRRPRPTQVTSTTGQDINSESTERTRIRQRVRITPSTSSHSQSSSDRRGFRISTSARSNSSGDIEQTNLNSNATNQESSFVSSTSQNSRVTVEQTVVSNQTSFETENSTNLEFNDSTEKSRGRQRVRITPSISSNSQSSFDRSGFRISTSGRSNSSTDYDQANVLDVTNHESSLNSSTSSNSGDVEQTLSSQSSLESRNRTTSLDDSQFQSSSENQQAIKSSQFSNLDSSGTTHSPEYASSSSSNVDLEQTTLLNLGSSSPDLVHDFESTTNSSQTLIESERERSPIEQSTSSNQILFQSRNFTSNQRSSNISTSKPKSSVDRRRFRIATATNRSASVNNEQTRTSSQIVAETQSTTPRTINRSRGTRKFFSRFTTEAFESFTDAPYRSNLTRKFRPVYQEPTEVNYNSLLNRNIRPESLDELSSLTAFDFNRKNFQSGNPTVRRRPRPTVATTTTTEEISTAATESSSTTESGRNFNRPISRKQYARPIITTTTPLILPESEEISNSNSQNISSQISTPSVDSSISLSLSKSYDFGFASRKPNSTVRTVYKNGSRRITKVNLYNKSQDSTFSDQNNLTTPATEQILPSDTTTTQIIGLASRKRNSTEQTVIETNSGRTSKIEVTTQFQESTIADQNNLPTLTIEQSLPFDSTTDQLIGLASRKQNSTEQNVFETDSHRTSKIDVISQFQDSTIAGQNNDLTTLTTEQSLPIDTTTAQIFPIAQNSLNVTTENNLSTNHIVTNSSQHVPLSDSKSSETIRTRSRVRTVKRLRDPVKENVIIENTIETTSNTGTESRTAIDFSLEANPTIETLANEGFNFQTTNNQTESDFQIRRRISTTTPPNTAEPIIQTERRRQFQSRISTTPIDLITETNSDLTETQGSDNSNSSTTEARIKVVNRTFRRRPATKLEINSNDTLTETVEANVERTKSVQTFNDRTRRPRPFSKPIINSEESDDDVNGEENLPLLDEVLESSTRKNTFIPPRRGFASRTTTTPATVNGQTESQISENVTPTSELKSTSRPRFKVFNRTIPKIPSTQLEISSEDKSEENLPLANEEQEEGETNSQIETSTQARKKFGSRFSTAQSKTESGNRISGSINSPKNNVRTFTRKPITNHNERISTDDNSQENLPLSDEEKETNTDVETSTQTKRKFAPRFSGSINSSKNNVRTFTRKPTTSVPNDNNSAENITLDDEELDPGFLVETTTQARRKLFAPRPFIAKAAISSQSNNETKIQISENIDVSSTAQQNSSLPTRRKFVSRISTTPASLKTQSFTENINSTQASRYNLLNRTRKPFAKPAIIDDNSEENSSPLADADVDSVTLSTETNFVTENQLTDEYTDSTPDVTTFEEDNTEEIFTMATEKLKPQTSTVAPIKPRRRVKIIKGTKRPAIELILNATEEVGEVGAEGNLSSTPEGEMEQTTQNNLEPNDETTSIFPILEINAQDEDNVSTEELEFHAQKTTDSPINTHIQKITTTAAASNEDVSDNITSTSAPKFKPFNRTFKQRPVPDNNSKENLPLGDEETERNSQIDTASIQSRRKYVSRISTAQSNVETESTSASNVPRYKVRTFTRKPLTRLTTTTNEVEDVNSEENLSLDNDDVESASVSSVPTRRTLRPRFPTTPSTVIKKVEGGRASENTTSTSVNKFKPFNRTFTRRPTATKLGKNSNATDNDNNSGENIATADEDKQSNSQNSFTQNRKYISKISATETSAPGFNVRAFTRKPQITNESDANSEESYNEEVVESNTQPDDHTELNEDDEIYENITTTSAPRLEAFNGTFTQHETSSNIFEDANNSEENSSLANDDLESTTQNNIRDFTEKSDDNDEVESNTQSDDNEDEIQVSEYLTTTSEPDGNSDETSEFKSNSQNDTLTQSKGTYVSITSTNQSYFETETSVTGNTNLTNTVGYNIRTFVTNTNQSDYSDNDEDNLDSDHGELIESDAEINSPIPTRSNYLPRISTTPNTVSIQANEGENINSTSAPRFKAFNRTFTRGSTKLEINSNGSNVDDTNSNANSPTNDGDDESNSQIDTSTQSKRLYISRTSNSETESRVVGNINSPKIPGYKVRAFTRKPIPNEPENDDTNSDEYLDNDDIESSVQSGDTSTTTRKSFIPRASTTAATLNLQSNDGSEIRISGNINSNRFGLVNRTRKPFGQVAINSNTPEDSDNSDEIVEDDEEVEPNVQIGVKTERKKYVSRITTTPVPPPLKYKLVSRPTSKSPFTTPSTILSGANDEKNSEENLDLDDEEEASEELNSGNVNSPIPNYRTIDRVSTRKPFTRPGLNINEDSEKSEESQSNSGTINSFNAPRYGVINRTRKPFTRPEENSDTPDDDYSSDENVNLDDDDEEEASVQTGNSGNTNSDISKYKTIDRTTTRRPFTRLQINANEPDDTENSQEFESDSASQTGGKYGSSVSQTNSESENRVSGNIRYGVINRTRKPFTLPTINANTPDDDYNSAENLEIDDDEDEASQELQSDSVSQTGGKYVSRISVTQTNSETENRVSGNSNSFNASKFGIVNRTRKPFTRPEVNSRTSGDNDNSDDNEQFKLNSPNKPVVPLRQKFVPRVSNTPTTLNVQSNSENGNRVSGNIPRFRTVSPRPTPNLAINSSDDDLDENEPSDEDYNNSYEENLTGNDNNVNSFSKFDSSTQSIRKFKPGNSVNLNVQSTSETSLPAGYRNKAIFQRKPYARPVYTNEPSDADNSEETATLKAGDEESNTESDVNSDNELVETTTILGEFISETNNNSGGVLWSLLSEQKNSSVFKNLGSNIVDYRNGSESGVIVNGNLNGSYNIPAQAKIVNKPFSRTINNPNTAQSTQNTGSQNSPIQSIKIDSNKFIPFHLRPKTINKPGIQTTTPINKINHADVETTTGSIPPNTEYTNTLDTSTPIISTIADTNLFSTLLSQESTTTFAGEDFDKVTTEIPIKILKPTTTTSKPTTLHHIFAVDYDSAEEDRNNGTNLGNNSTEVTDDDDSGTSKEASAEEISQRLEKLVEINRIVEIYSKQQSNGRNDLSGNSNELVLEKIPTIDKIGEISRWISVKLQNHNYSNPNNFQEILQNITQLASLNSTETASIPLEGRQILQNITNLASLNTTENSTFDSKMIFAIETSTIPLEGLFDKNKKKNFTDNEVIDYQVTKPPPLLASPPQAEHDNNPKNADSFAGSTSFAIAAATIPSHNYVQQLRPESHEANPLVISIANLDQVVLSKSDKVIDKKILFPSVITAVTESTNNQLTFSSSNSDDRQTN